MGRMVWADGSKSFGEILMYFLFLVNMLTMNPFQNDTIPFENHQEKSELIPQ
jgi:hypothetical protein